MVNIVVSGSANCGALKVPNSSFSSVICHARACSCTFFWHRDSILRVHSAFETERCFTTPNQMHLYVFGTASLQRNCGALESKAHGGEPQLPRFINHFFESHRGPALGDRTGGF